MQLFGIGIDVVEVDRIQSSIEEFGDQFIQRIFTEKEQEYCEQRKNKYLHYAARFAAKEAVAKAFGTGIGEALSWLDMEILNKETGEPELYLSGSGKQFAEQHEITTIKVSLSHAKHYAAANAVALSK